MFSNFDGEHIHLKFSNDDDAVAANSCFVAFDAIVMLFLTLQYIFLEMTC